MIFQISIYDGDGQIIRHAEGPEMDLLLLNVGPDEDWLPGHYDSNVFFAKGGQPVEKPTKPAGIHWIFDTASEAWIDPRTPEDHAAELVSARQTAIREIAAIRGAARLAYITDLPGQDMLYIAKMEEARAFIAEAEPDPADYPLIASEVGVTAPTAEEVAQVFLNLNALWRLAAGAIDAACFGAEAAVYAATTATEIDAALIALAAQLALNA